MTITGHGKSSAEGLFRAFFVMAALLRGES